MADIVLNLLVMHADGQVGVFLDVQVIEQVSTTVGNKTYDVGQELVFRGLLYGWLTGRWGKTVGWIVSSLVFAAAHAEPAHIILVLPLGLLFGWLLQRTDSLLPSLVAHIANNGLALIAAAYLDV